MEQTVASLIFTFILGVEAGIVFTVTTRKLMKQKWFQNLVDKII